MHHRDYSAHGGDDESTFVEGGECSDLEADLVAKYVEKMMRGEASENSLTVEDLVPAQGF